MSGSKIIFLSALNILWLNSKSSFLGSSSLNNPNSSNNDLLKHPKGTVSTNSLFVGLEILNLDIPTPKILDKHKETALEKTEEFVVLVSINPPTFPIFSSEFSKTWIHLFT